MSHVTDLPTDLLTAEVLLMANRSSLNDTEGEQDYEEREKKMTKVQAMLREMRSRSCVGQKKLADKEKTEAEKCEFIHSEKHRLNHVSMATV